MTNANKTSRSIAEKSAAVHALASASEGPNPDCEARIILDVCGEFGCTAEELAVWQVEELAALDAGRPWPMQR